MDKSTPLAPAIQEFLNDALPNDGGAHTLVVGENHTHPEHLTWLQHNPINAKHRIGTIGVEHSPYMNVLFWAYQDGTLEQWFGSKDSAQAYVSKALIGVTKPEFHAAEQARIPFILDALDNGIRVVAYDSRHLLALDRFLCNNTLNELQSPKALLENKNLAEDIASQYDLKSSLESVVQLLDYKPEYRERLNTLESLIKEGNKKGIGSDAISACVLDAMAAPNRNRIAIIGYGHLDGVGDKKRKVHGTFGQHLFAVGQPAEAQRPHKVTQAIMAAVVPHNQFYDRRESLVMTPGQHFIAAGDIHLVNLDHGTIQPFPKLSLQHPRVKTPEEALGSTAHVNPLLIPDIKRAADAVRVMMNGEDKSIAP